MRYTFTQLIYSPVPFTKSRSVARVEGEKRTSSPSLLEAINDRLVVSRQLVQACVCVTNAPILPLQLLSGVDARLFIPCALSRQVGRLRIMPLFRYLDLTSSKLPPEACLGFS